jgi:F-type H+-transporting ATPase subunit b
MQINATLLGQIITFAIFVWFCMKFIWPHLTGAIRTRQTMIADGLAAADQSQKQLEDAHVKVEKMLQEAKQEAARLLEKTEKRSYQMIDEAKQQALKESDRIIANAHAEIEQDIAKAKENLYREVAEFSVLGIEKMISRSVSEKDQKMLMDQLLAEVK